jgi:O-antigen ligase
MRCETKARPLVRQDSTIALHSRRNRRLEQGVLHLRVKARDKAHVVMQAVKSHAMEFLPFLGNYLVGAILATCLFLDIPIGGIFIVYMSALALLSGFASVWQSVGNFDRNFVRSDIGRYYLVISMLTIICILLSIHHGETGELEIALKRFFIAYVVVNLVWRYSVDTVLVGTAAGAVVACAVALSDIFLLDLHRAVGPTNSVRFGMIAALFSMISIAGFMSGQKTRLYRALLLAGGFGGLIAASLSGTRGAALAIPLMWLPLLGIVLKRRNAARFATIAVYAAVAVSLFFVDSGNLRSRSSTAVSELESFADGSSADEDEVAIATSSLATRARLLELSFELFRQNPVTGVGSAGWAAAIDPLFLSDRLAVRFNQAHNQFANDFAKGGLVRGLAGIAFILAPLLFFLRSKPLADREESLPALLGLVTCIGFAAFSVTESVMILNLPASIYCILTFYLMAAKRPLWQKPAGWPEQPGRREPVSQASAQ